MANPTKNRIEALRRSLRGIDGLLITNHANVRYLTGFTGSSGFALVTKDKAVFATDLRYKEQAQREVSGWEMVIEKNRLETIKRLAGKSGIKTLGFENGVSYDFFSRLKSKVNALKPVKAAIERLRETKDAEELRLIKEAVRRAEGAYIEVLPHIGPGAKEVSIARRLEEALKKRGSRKLPFDIIVASGANSAMPHARPTEKRLVPGDLVVIDWGAEAEGYFSDITRTLLIRGDAGGNTSKKKEIYGIVLRANRAAIEAVGVGRPLKEIDKAARDVIKKAGYGECFGHGTGHGVGLAVHEAPGISAKAGERVREGMVFTIEPGIYLPGLGGVRIEDMAAVGKKAAVLTSLPVSLKIIG